MVWHHGTDGVLLVPNTGVMATIVARQRNDSKPRFKRSHLQAKLLRNTFLDALNFDVAIDICHHAERQHLGQYPRRRIRVRISALEMIDEIFARTIDFGINQRHCVGKLALIGKVSPVGHPERIARKFAAYVDNGTAYGYFDLLDFVENEQSQLLVESVECHHLTERTTRLVLMLLLGHPK